MDLAITVDYRHPILQGGDDTDRMMTVAGDAGHSAISGLVQK